MEGGPHLKMSLLGEKSLSTDALDGTSELYLTNSCNKNVNSGIVSKMLFRLWIG